ncbi:MAG: hypothetical protein OXH06_05340 [Gemmatimonadetes bacterium]|nr:hypothetical protein [Gemmatimonadota bacterium]MDE3258180.1 hypothetical protein [Gemmatimonadota bacterium]
MPILELPEGRLSYRTVGRLAWLSIRIAAGVACVVVPFGYAITGVHKDVLMGAGSGLAFGIGIGLRVGQRAGLSTGILIGSVAGLITALLAGLIPQDGTLFIVPPVVALAVGLIDGISPTVQTGYRRAVLESLTMSVLLGLGLLPGLGHSGIVSSLMVMAPTALIAGSYGQIVARRRYRPPVLLILGSLAVWSAIVFLVAQEYERYGSEVRIDDVPISHFVVATIYIIVFMIIVPIATFLAGRAAAVWIQPRLRVYRQLTEYLRVMWVPIGSFAIGYLTLIVLFAGFYGMLGRFFQDAFSGDGAASGVIDWIAFSFFTSLARDYSEIVPQSLAARALVAGHLVLSIGWGLVVFAAVMSYLQPQIERIARREETDGDGHAST